MKVEQLIEMTDKVKTGQYLLDQIKRGDNIISALNISKYGESRYRISKDFTMGSSEFRLTEEEFNILLEVNKSLLQSFINKRKQELENL